MIFNMRNAIIVAGLAGSVAIAGPALAAEEYSLDKTHADVVFAVDHLGLSKTYGRFKEVDGTLMLDEQDVSKSSVTFTLQADSIDTNLAKRDDHLRGPDFFNAGEHPTLTFTSTDVKQTSPSTADIIGELTMVGVTRPVTLHATLNHVGDHPRDPSKKAAGFSATTKLRRTDFGMGYGVPFVGDSIDLIIEVEWLRDK